MGEIKKAVETSKIEGPKIDSVFDEAAPKKEEKRGSVSVAHGLYSYALPVAGMTVSEIRAEFKDLLDIDPGAVALVDGEDSTEDSRVTEGAALLFVKKAAEKGKSR